MGRNFDRVALRYDEARGGEQRGDVFAVEIEPHLPANADALVLEVGVGTGVVAAALRRRGRRVVGVDIAIEMLRVASRRVPGSVARYDGWRLPFASSAVDAGYLVWVIHLVEDQRALLREVARVLRPGGRLIVATINREPEDEISRITEPMYRTLLGDRWASDDLDRVAGVASSVELREVRRVPGIPYGAETSGVLQAQGIEARNASVFWDLSDEAWRAHVAPVLDRLRAMGDVPVIREQTHEILVLEQG